MNTDKLLQLIEESDMVQMQKNVSKGFVNRAKEKKADICIFGHTHREYIEEKNKIKFINPGALQDKKYILWAENKFIEKKLK